MLPKGYRLALSVRGTDYVFPGEPGAGLETLGKVWTGVGPFTHDDPRDRPPAVFGGDVTLHTGPGPAGLRAAAGHPEEIAVAQHVIGAKDHELS